MSLPTYYAQVMLNLHKKYGLSQNAKKLLQAHDDWKLGRIDQDELGRIVRMSPNLRKAIIDTITKVNNAMKKKPEESKICCEIIQACTEILNALETTTSLTSFPLMKLPAEIRQRVYGFYINRFTWPKITAATYPNMAKCHCTRFVSPGYYPTRTFNLSLARTCSKVRDEFLEYFYRETPLYFTCACELGQRLSNDIMRMTLRKIRVHWTGPDSDKAFLLLAKCPKLSELDVVVSQTTTNDLTHRETEMRRFFTSKRQPRIADALGLDELLMIRGMEKVEASHLSFKQGTRKTEDERASLEALLTEKLKAPRTTDDEDNSTST